MPLASGAAGPTDPVDELFGRLGHIEVDHQGDIDQIQAARGDVGGEQQLMMTAAETIMMALRAFCLSSPDKAAALSPLSLNNWARRSVGTGGGKDDGLLVAFVTQQMLEQRLFVIQMITEDEALFDILMGGQLLSHGDAVRIIEQHGCQLFEFGMGGGRREHQSLA